MLTFGSDYVTKQTYTLLCLGGISCFLTVIALISGTDIYLAPLMHGPAWSLVLLVAAWLGVLVLCGLASLARAALWTNRVELPDGAAWGTGRGSDT